MASAPNQTASPPTLEHVAERAVDLYRLTKADNERLRDELAAADAKRRKAIAQAKKAIPMLRQYQAKLKAALAANGALERRATTAEQAVATAEKLAAAAEERARQAEKQVAAALSHARAADKRAESAEAHVKAAEGKAAIEGRLRRMRAAPRRRAA
jgi:hypothetical protein